MVTKQYDTYNYMQHIFPRHIFYTTILFELSSFLQHIFVGLKKERRGRIELELDLALALLAFLRPRPRLRELIRTRPLDVPTPRPLEESLGDSLSDGDTLRVVSRHARSGREPFANTTSQGALSCRPLRLLIAAIYIQRLRLLSLRRNVWQVLGVQWISPVVRYPHFLPKLPKPREYWNWNKEVVCHFCKIKFIYLNTMSICYKF